MYCKWLLSCEVEGGHEMKVPQWLNTSSLYNQRRSIERPLSFPAVRIHSGSEVGNRAGCFTWHSHALCFPPCSFSRYFKTAPLCAGHHIVQRFLLGSLLTLTHTTQVCICLPGKWLSPRSRYVSFQSCSTSTVSQFLPDSVVSWLVCPTLN